MSYKPGWAPTIVHADGTDCTHDGTPLSGVNDPDGPVCGGGQPVTHIRFNGQTLTIAEASALVMKLGEVMAEAMKPIVKAFEEMGRKLAQMLLPGAEQD
jgi:hypothetical protein